MQFEFGTTGEVGAGGNRWLPSGRVSAALLVTGQHHEEQGGVSPESKEGKQKWTFLADALPGAVVPLLDLSQVVLQRQLWGGANQG